MIGRSKVATNIVFWSGLLFLLARTATVKAQTNDDSTYLQSGPAHIGGTVALSGPWNIIHGTAGTANIQEPIAALHYRNEHSIPQLGIPRVIGLLPINSGTFGLSLERQAFDEYRRYRSSLTYGRSLGPKLKVGISLDHFAIRIGNGYGKADALSIQMGLQGRLSDALTLGMHITNPTRSQLHPAMDERLPTRLRLGAAQYLDQDLSLSVSMTKAIEEPIVLRAGVDYRIKAPLTLRLGISSHPVMPGFGLAYEYKKTTIHLATRYHQLLGYSIQGAFGFTFS